MLLLEIVNCYKEGLQALKAVDRQRIVINNTRKLCGSVDLDSCLEERYPNDNRWDYIICYNDVLHFVEIHSASGASEVATIVNKAKWLRNWLKENTFETKRHTPFLWVSTNQVDKAILSTSTYRKRLAMCGVTLVGRELRLS